MLTFPGVLKCHFELTELALLLLLLLIRLLLLLLLLLSLSVQLLLTLPPLLLPLPMCCRWVVWLTNKQTKTLMEHNLLDGSRKNETVAALF